MPCDTIQTVTVKFTANNTDTALLAAALKEAGYSLVIDAGDQVTFTEGRVRGVYTKATGDVTFSNLGSEQQAEERVRLMKKHYSKQVALATAKKFGWKVQPVGEFKFEFVKNTL
jgi:hypothetical protein